MKIQLYDADRGVSIEEFWSNRLSANFAVLLALFLLFIGSLLVSALIIVTLMMVFYKDSIKVLENNKVNLVLPYRD